MAQVDARWPHESPAHEPAPQHVAVPVALRRHVPRARHEVRVHAAVLLAHDVARDREHRRPVALCQPLDDVRQVGLARVEMVAPIDHKPPALPEFGIQVVGHRSQGTAQGAHVVVLPPRPIANDEECRAQPSLAHHLPDLTVRRQLLRLATGGAPPERAGGRRRRRGQQRRQERMRPAYARKQLHPARAGCRGPEPAQVSFAAACAGVWTGRRPAGGEEAAGLLGRFLESGFLWPHSGF